MRQYSVDIWSSSTDHLSKMVLCRLLDQDATNITEKELWKFVISWSKMECKLKNIDPTPKNIRAIIEDCGLLKKIRFLTFSEKDLLESVEPFGVLNASELTALIDCIESIRKAIFQCHDKDCGDDDNKCVSVVNYSDRNSNQKNLVVPDGFNCNHNARLRVATSINHCMRKILTKRKTWTYGGTVSTKVMSQTLVLVIGFEVFTRIPSSAEYSFFPANIGHYNERLVVKICDDQGSEIAKTDYNGIAEFNSSQNIKLKHPVWFYPHRKYVVTFELPAGQYPLSQLSGAASSKIAVFRFEDFSNYPEGYLDFSFISAVMFSL